MLKDSDTCIKSFSHRQKFEIGYLMMRGQDPKAIQQEFGVSRSYAYELKGYAEKVLDKMDAYDPDARLIVLTDALIQRIVIALALICRSPLEGIWRFFSEIFQISVSVPKASAILKEASERASRWDKGVSLENIQQGANDEIFQGENPVFSGIDVVSTYVYLLEEMPDRKGDTWKSAMEDAKSRGLDLKVAISDQGSGLLSGVPKAFPKADIQYDVFHEVREVRKSISKMERRAFGFIKREYDLCEKAESAREESKGKYAEWLGKARDKSVTYAGAYDDMGILCDWLRELLGFSGYSAKESMDLACWVVDSMADAAYRAEEFDLYCDMKGLKDKLPLLLGFVRRLQVLMDDKAEARGIPSEAYHVLYHLKTHAEGSPEHFHLSRRVDRLLKGQRQSAEEELREMIWLTKRASSLVENLNSRIRPFINLKRVVPERFFVLMKVFFNTKKYRRSAIDDRVGKSPIELLTGKEYPDFFELLGY